MRMLTALAITFVMTLGCGDSGSNSTGTTDGTTTEGTTDEGTTDEGTTDEDAGTSTGDEDTKEPEDTNGTGGDGQPEVVILPPDNGGSSSGSTGDDVETTPPTTCKEALPCQLACKDSDCNDACVADAETAVTDPYAAMVSCLSTECGGPTNKSEKYECLLGLCFDSFHGCYLNGVIGEDTCDNTEKCSGACADADCQYECVKNAKKIAQQNYLKLHICIQEFCDNNPLLSEEDCTKTGQGVCGIHYNHCISGS